MNLSINNDNVKVVNCCFTSTIEVVKLLLMIRKKFYNFMSKA